MTTEQKQLLDAAKKVSEKLEGKSFVGRDLRDDLRQAIAAAEQAQAEPSQQLTAVHVRAMAAGLHDGMGGHADACAELMEQLAKSMVAAEQAQADIGKAISQQSEPVAWLYEAYVWSEGWACYAWREILERERPNAGENVRNITPLYAQPPAPQQAEPVQNAKLATAIQQADLAEVAAEAERRKVDPGSPQAVGFFSGWVEGGEDGQPVEFMVTAYGDLPPVGTKLYAQPPAVATDAITDAMEANAWRAALRGLCTGRELMTPDECAEHVRHRIESAKSCTKQPAVADRDAIRRVFLAHGFTIKDGQADLRPYVYEAAEALLRELSPAVAVPAAPQGVSESPAQWPQERDVGRIGDMSKVASLRVGLDADSDVYVCIHGEAGSGSVEFCVPGTGGGKSPRTRAALISLMVAMEADNAETPSRDWWKAREGDAQKGGEA